MAARRRAGPFPFSCVPSGSVAYSQVTDVYGGDQSKSAARVNRIIDAMDKDKDGTISVAEFLRRIQQYPLLLYPAYSVQDHIRKKIMGTQWWKEKEKIRREKLNMVNVYDLLALSKDTYVVALWHFPPPPLPPVLVLCCLTWTRMHTCLFRADAVAAENLAASSTWSFRRYPGSSTSTIRNTSMQAT